MLNGVPPENIINYDETNLTDDPGWKKCIFKQRVKYSEFVMNQTKSSTSIIMYAGTASGKVMPPYVVTKKNTCGTLGHKVDRQEPVTLAQEVDGLMPFALKIGLHPLCCHTAKYWMAKKVLIGDNFFLPHLWASCKGLWEEQYLVCLPTPNSTHLCQPLDVAYFRSMKKA